MKKTHIKDFLEDFPSILERENLYRNKLFVIEKGEKKFATKAINLIESYCIDFSKSNKISRSYLLNNLLEKQREVAISGQGHIKSLKKKISAHKIYGVGITTNLFFDDPLIKIKKMDLNSVEILEKAIREKLITLHDKLEESLEKIVNREQERDREEYLRIRKDFFDNLSTRKNCHSTYQKFTQLEKPTSSTNCCLCDKKVQEFKVVCYRYAKLKSRLSKLDSKLVSFNNKRREYANSKKIVISMFTKFIVVLIFLWFVVLEACNLIFCSEFKLKREEIKKTIFFLLC